MLSILNNLKSRNRGTVRFPEWDYVRDGLMMNLDNTKKYYRHGGYAVSSDHELIKLMFGLTVSTDTELDRYYQLVDDKALTVAQQLGYTTTMSKGHVFNNVFFAGNSKEVIIVENEPFDPAEATANWRDLRPIKVLRHGFDTIDCFPLNGTVKSNGVSVFAINLPMMAVQYRAYREWQKTYEKDFEGRNSIYHFIYSYPIGNMIYDAMDQSILNRLVRINQGIEPSDNTFRHPFHITNFTVRCDRLLGKIDTLIKSQNQDMAGIATTIPLVVSEDLLEWMRLPDLMETQQINWAIYLARIDLILFLLSYGQSVINHNQSEIDKIKYTLRRYMNDGTIQTALPKELFAKQKLVIERLIKS